MRTTWLVAPLIALTMACGGSDSGGSSSVKDGGSSAGRAKHKTLSKIADGGDDTSQAGRAALAKRDAGAQSTDEPDAGERDAAATTHEHPTDAGHDIDSSTVPLTDGGRPAPPPEPTAGMCADPGQDCSKADCCDGSTCVTDGTFFVCAANCASGDECNSGCCAALDTGGSVCSPATFCAAPIASNGSCADLVLLADDGTYLGDASSSTFATDGVCNQYSNYGSAYSSTSIFNQYGTYGSQYSLQSAYDPYTQTPPFLFCASTKTVMNAVSKNTLVPGAIDPDSLCAVLAQNGF